MKLNGQWTLSIGDHVIGVHRLGFRTTYNLDIVRCLISVLDQVPLCYGKEKPRTVTVSRISTETISVHGNEKLEAVPVIKL